MFKQEFKYPVSLLLQKQDITNFYSKLSEE